MQRIVAAVALLVGTWLLWPSPVAVEAQAGLVTINSNADVTGTNAVIAAATSGSARWVQAVAGSGNSAPLRCGGATTSSTVGVSVAAGGVIFYPALPIDTRLNTTQFLYNLANVRCYVATGDKVNFSWATN